VKSDRASSSVDTVDSGGLASSRSMAVVPTLLQATGHWFLHSGIQSPNGGVARYYRSDLQSNAPISTEITGYTVSALLFLYSSLEDPKYLEAALRSARFLTRTAWDPSVGAFPFEYFTDQSRSCAQSYFFDTGITIRGLLAAWRLTQEVELRDTCIAAGRGLLADFYTPDGIHPILVLPHKQPFACESRWSASPGCYQLKAALAWYELFEVTGEMFFLRAYESVVERTVASERDFLPGEADPHRVMDRLHAYAYFLEGLLPLLHQPDCISVFSDGLNRAASYLRDIAGVFDRSDVYAQLLRLRLYGSLAGIPLDLTAAGQYAQQVMAFQIASDDPRTSGGFLFGRKCGRLLPFVNPASSAFCAQALALWQDYKNDSINADYRCLI
jgi:hypothetical protein